MLLILGGILLCSTGVHEVLAASKDLINEYFMEIRFQGLSENYDDYGGDYENSVPQGMAGNGNTVYLLKTRSSKVYDDRSYIIKILNANSGSPKMVLPANEVYVEHGNGMTYYNGNIYIASGDGCDDAVFRVRETNNSTEGWGPETEWTYEYETPDFDVDTMTFDTERLTVNGINGGEDIMNIAHYTGNYFIVCLKSSYSGSTNTLIYGVGPINGSTFTIQKRFTVTAPETFSDVQDIDYCEGYLWIALYKHNDTLNNIHLVELPTSYAALENGKIYEVKKTVTINKNEAGRSGTKNELEAVYVNGQYIYTWSNIRTGWNETFCRYSRFPNGVTVTSVTTKSETSLEIKWNAVDYAQQYQIDRRIAGGEFSTIKTVGSSSTSFIDTGLTAGTKYYYRVYGVNSAGKSPKKGGVDGVTKTVIPKVNSVTALSESDLKVKWTAVAGATKYIVCRKREGTGEGWQYYTRVKEVTGTEYTDTGLEPNTMYYYGIIAVNEKGVESGGTNGNPGDNKMSGRTLEAIQITLNKQAIALAAGETYKLAATVTPTYAASGQIKWTSGNSSSVTVEQDGSLMALESGTAVITAAEQMKNKTSSCLVTVYKPDFVLPADLTVIEESAFEGIDARTVYIPDNCISIGAYAFRNSSVEQIRIPANCEIGDEVFAGCKNVTVLGIPGSYAETYAQENGLGFIETN